MRKKRNIIKRNSGFIVGCVLAAGASFVTADTLMERGVSFTAPSTEGQEDGTIETVAPETSENRVYETDAFTVTASGNIIKGVETEPPKQTEESETKETDENGNPVGETDQTDENGDSAADGEDGADSGSSDGSSDGAGSEDYDTDGSSGEGGSYEDDGSGSSGGGGSDSGGYGDSGSSGDIYYEQPIEIYDPGNGDYYYTDSSSSGGGSSSGGNSSSGGGSSSGSASTPSDVILWGISERYIDESELYNYSADELRLIRNEIFALHGRIFNAQDLNDYFSQKSWYVPTYAPDDFDANMFYYLNDYEEANLNVILNYEAALAEN